MLDGDEDEAEATEHFDEVQILKRSPWSVTTTRSALSAWA
jgi:hypothetical protein